jgi:hypothetical protein
MDFLRTLGDLDEDSGALVADSFELFFAGPEVMLLLLNRGHHSVLYLPIAFLTQSILVKLSAVNPFSASLTGYCVMLLFRLVAVLDRTRTRRGRPIRDWRRNACHTTP